MAGIDFPGHDESWSLFSKQWRFHPRMIYVIEPVDFDKAAFGKNCELVMPASAATP